MNDPEGPQKKDWDKLFALIPVIEGSNFFGKVRGGEKTPDGAVTTYFIEPAEVVGDFFQIVHELDLVPVFDWNNWDEGWKLLADEKADFSSLPVETLSKLLTVIFRTNRFDEGYLVACFYNGTILKILKAFRHNIYPGSSG